MTSLAPCTELVSVQWILGKEKVYKETRVREQKEQSVDKKKKHPTPLIALVIINSKILADVIRRMHLGAPYLMPNTYNF